MRKQILSAVFVCFLAIPLYSQQAWDRPMEMKRCSIYVSADQFTATTLIEWEFCNNNDREIEGLFQFGLKPGQVVTAFQLDLNGKYRDGSIEEKWKATGAYNAIVGKRIDPALLVMDYADHYSLRIYPVPAHGCRKVTLTISQLLSVENGRLVYQLPLNVNQPVRDFELNISLNSPQAPSTLTGLVEQELFRKSGGRHALSVSRQNIQLNRPVGFSIPLSSKAALCRKSGEQQSPFALRFQSSYQKETRIHPRKLTVFWDASASLARRDLDKEINFLKQFISYNKVSQLTIIPFNYRLLDTAVFYTEQGFNSRWPQYLGKIQYDGSTQLGVIDLNPGETDMAILFSDGNNTYGKKRPSTGNTLVSCVFSSPTANEQALGEIVGAAGGKLIDLHRTSISRAVLESSTRENWLMEIRSSAGRLVVEQELPLKQANSIFINGLMPSATDTLFLDFGSNNGIEYVEKVTAGSANDCPGSSVDRINMLNEFDRITRRYSWSDIIDFGLKEKVVTPYTAYIVLERVEDYVRYNITPLKELEEECLKMNYVKKDTRFERKRQETLSELQVMNKTIDMYNQRIDKWDVNEKKLAHLTRETGAVMDAKAGTPGVAARDQPAESTLLGSESNLEEVVVVGYGTMKRKNITGSVAYITDREISAAATSVEQVLQGRVPGLQVTNASPAPGSSAMIHLRGSGTLGSNNQPLFVLDGVPVSGNINDLVTVYDIDNITVLKDVAASAIYGSRAASGAIVINTRRGKTHYNWYNSKPYRLKDMEDVEYLEEIKAAAFRDKDFVYEKLKEEYGGNAGFYFDMAQHFFELGMKARAFEILMNACEAANGSQQVLIATAFYLEQWKQFEEAASVYEQIMADNPRQLALYSDLGWCYYQSGKIQKAVNTFYAGITSRADLQEARMASIKAMLLNEMNAIIAMHKAEIDLRGIPATLIKPLPVDLRIMIECNRGNLSDITIREPGGFDCSYTKPVSKNGGTIQQGFYWYDSSPFEYQLRNAPAGKYRITVNYYDYNNYYGRIPSVIRIKKFRNFGRSDQSIEIENLMMDNQNGQVEIAGFQVDEKHF